MQVLQIPLARVRPARAIRGAKTNVDDLVEAFKACGQLHPILVVARAGDTYDVYAGHRRVRAARKLRWQTIAAVIHAGADLEAEQMAIYENLSRRDLTVKTQAREIARLRDLQRQLGVSKKTANKGLMEKTGLAKRTVQRFTKLGERATDELLDAVDAGHVTLHAAEKLAGQGPEEQAAAAAAAARAETRAAAPRSGVRWTKAEIGALNRLVDEQVSSSGWTFSDARADTEELWRGIQAKVRRLAGRAPH